MKIKPQICLNALVYIALSFMLGVLYDRMYMLNRWGLDDFEHLLAANFIHNGYRPYADFFQHHHPLMWYLLSPLFSVIKNPLNSYFIARTFMGILWGAGCVFLALIVKRLGGTIQTCLYTLFVYLTFGVCAAIYIQTRPDTPMVFCLICGTYFWISFYQNHKLRNLVMCYLLYWLSFAFLQKAGMFLLPFGIYQIVLLGQKKLNWKQVLSASLLPLILTGGYFFYLYQTDSLLRYWELNWVLNAKWDRSFRVYSVDINSLLYTISGVGSLLYGCCKTKGLMRQLSAVGLGFAVIFLTVPKCYGFYWVMFSPVVALGCGFAVSSLMKKGFWACLLSMGFMAWMLISVFIYLWIPRSIQDIHDWDRMSQIIKEIGPDDQMVMYGDYRFAFAKPYPEDYYYFNLEVGALLDRDLFHRHELPNWDKIVYETKPKFVLGMTLHYCVDHDERCQNEKLMGADKEFLKQHYTWYYPPYVWKRKE